MKPGDRVRIKERQRFFYNAPKGFRLYADPKYREEYTAKAAEGVIDSINQEGDEVVYVVKVGLRFHSVIEEEIEEIEAL